MSDTSSESISQLLETGCTIIKNAFTTSEVDNFRLKVLDNRALMKSTRPTPSSRHLAGFHRFPTLEPLHSAVTGNAKLAKFLEKLFLGDTPISIGLSDITINRSQPWHTDLLRGEFSQFVDEKACWDQNGGGVYKLLVYLQAGTSLRIAPGMHKDRTPLDDEELEHSLDHSSTCDVTADTGDVVVMDIRLPHCGADEQAMQRKSLEDNPKILISTVVGALQSPFTRQMQLGNMARMLDWDQREPFLIENSPA